MTLSKFTRYLPASNGRIFVDFLHAIGVFVNRENRFRYELNAAIHVAKLTNKARTISSSSGWESKRQIALYAYYNLDGRSWQWHTFSTAFGRVPVEQPVPCISARHLPSESSGPKKYKRNRHRQLVRISPPPALLASSMYAHSPQFFHFSKSAPHFCSFASQQPDYLVPVCVKLSHHRQKKKLQLAFMSLALFTASSKVLRALTLFAFHS